MCVATNWNSNELSQDFFPLVVGFSYGSPKHNNHLDFNWKYSSKGFIVSIHKSVELHIGKERLLSCVAFTANYAVNCGACNDKRS